jgi:hypothetical protein
MDPDALLERHLQESEWVRIPQLRLDAERQLRERLELDAEPLTQTLALQPLELRPRQRLEFGLEDRHAGDYSVCASASRIDQEASVRAAFIAIERAGVTYFLEVLTLASQNAESWDPGACRRR